MLHDPDGAQCSYSPVARVHVLPHHAEGMLNIGGQALARSRNLCGHSQAVRHRTFSDPPSIGSSNSAVECRSC